MSSSSEKSLLLQTAVLHIHGQAEREDALHSLAILGLFKYLELTDDVVVDCDTLHLILSKTNGLFRQLLARRSSSIINTASSTASKSTSLTSSDTRNNTNTNTYSSNNNNNNNNNNDSNKSNKSKENNDKKQGSHRANLTSHFPFADSQGSVLEILKEGSSDLTSSKDNKASSGPSNDTGVSSNKNNNGAESNNHSSNSRGYKDNINSGKAAKQVRISDNNDNYNSSNKSSNNHKSNNNSSSRNNTHNNSNKVANNAVKSKGSGMSECAFLSMGLPARIRLAKKVFGEFKSGNTGMQLKDVPEAVRCLGIPVSRTLDRACSRFNSRQSKSQSKGNKTAEKDFYVIDKSINLDQWLKLISRYTTRNAYMDKLSSGEEKMSSRDDNVYRPESDSGDSLLKDDDDDNEDVAVSDGTDGDYNSYGEETLRRFIIDPDDDDVALAVSADRKTRAGSVTDVSEAFGDAFGSVASAAARRRSAALSQRSTFPYAPPHVVPSSGSREREIGRDSERERPQSAKASYSNYSNSTSPSAYLSSTTAARGAKASKAVKAAAVKFGREGAEYLSKIRGVKSAIGDRIRADRSYYNKNSEFVSHSALSSVARRRVKLLVEKPLPFILSDGDDDEDDYDYDYVHNDGRENREVKDNHHHSNRSLRSDSARRKEYSRLKDVASGSAVRMIADSFLDSSLAREMLGHRSKYSGADPSLEQDYSFGSYESEDSRQTHHHHLYKSVRDRMAPVVSLGEGMDSSNSLDDEMAREELNYLIPSMAANNNNNINNNISNINISSNNITHDGNALASTTATTHHHQQAAAAPTTTRPDAKDTAVDSKDKIYISSKASKNGWSADFGHGIASNKNKNNKSNRNNKDADDSSGKFLSTYELGIKPWNRVASKISSSSSTSSSSLLLSHSKDVSVDVYTSRPPPAASLSGRSSKYSSELDTVHVLDASASASDDNDDHDDNDVNVNDNNNDDSNTAINHNHQSNTGINSSSILNAIGDSIKASLALKDVV